MNLQCWMKEISGDVPLLSLNIPGAHNSAARLVQLPRRSQCQSLSIEEQLCIGVRSLDIRVKPKNGRLVLVHAFAKVFSEDKSPMDLEEVLSQCLAFLSKNPSEAVILQFKNDNNRHQEQCFDCFLNTYLKDNETHWYLGNTAPSLQQARGKIVLVRRCQTDKEIGIDFSSWEEQDEKIPEPLTLNTGKDSFVIQDRYSYKPEDKWKEVVLPFLDSCSGFGGKYICNFTSTAGGIKGPRHNAEYINRRLFNYPLDKEKYYGTIYLDFADERLTSKIVALNFR